MQKAVVILLLLLVPAFAIAQKDSVNQDKLFQQARELAFTNKWKEARLIARVILKNNDRYNDARILIGRTYAWESKFDSARIELSRVIATDSSNMDALSALTDVYYWSASYEKALTICNKALTYAPYDKELLMKKVKILLALDKEDQARIVLVTLLNIDPYGYSINTLLASLHKYHNRVAVEHTFDYFSKPYHQRWHVASFHYQHDSKNATIIGKINVGQRVNAGQNLFSNPELQFEVDAYPVIRRGTYMYLNLGVSPGLFFPRVRLGVEPFQALGNGWECSLGGRVLFIKAQHDVSIFTGSINNYSKRNYWSLRPFFTYSGSYSEALYLQYRHYLSSTMNFVGGTLGYGNSPDVTNSVTQNGLQFGNSGYHFRFEFQHLVNSHIMIRLMPEYSFEEYISGSYRSRYTSNVYVAYLF